MDIAVPHVKSSDKVVGVPVFPPLRKFREQSKCRVYSSPMTWWWTLPWSNRDAFQSCRLPGRRPIYRRFAIRLSRSQERVNPAGERPSMRERVKQFEMYWGVKHTGIVAVPPAVPGDRRFECDLVQDACAWVDEQRGGLSLGNSQWRL